MAMAEAVLGGGCFWCLDAAYRQLEGVQEVESGYAGGRTRDPTYEQVCSGVTGHAEVVRITHDPDVIRFAELLDVFWVIHDPTTLNRQGADTGTQYRSVIFWLDEVQRVAAEQSRQQAQTAFDSPIVTELSALETFWPAEPYHQDYYRLNDRQPYCQMVISPKLQKLRQRFGERLRS